MARLTVAVLLVARMFTPGGGLGTVAERVAEAADMPRVDVAGVAGGDDFEADEVAERAEPEDESPVAVVTVVVDPAVTEPAITDPDVPALISDAALRWGLDAQRMLRIGW